MTLTVANSNAEAHLVTCIPFARHLLVLSAHYVQKYV